MVAFLITLLFTILLGAAGTIISLRLFANRAGRITRPKRPRRIYLAPGSYLTDTNIFIGNSDTGRYTRRAIGTVAVLLLALSALIYGAIHVMVAH